MTGLTSTVWHKTNEQCEKKIRTTQTNPAQKYVQTIYKPALLKQYFDKIQHSAIKQKLNVAHTLSRQKGTGWDNLQYPNRHH